MDNKIKRVSFFGNLKDQLDEFKYLLKNWREAKDCVKLQGWVTIDHIRSGPEGFIRTFAEPKSNIFTTEGRNHINDLVWGATSKDTETYIGVFSANAVPAAGDTAAAKLGGQNPYQAVQHAASGGYDAADNGDTTETPEGGNHAVYKVAASASSVITNSANKIHLTMDATLTLYGAYLTNIQATNGTSGKLYAAKAFTSSRGVVPDDEIYITYSITLSSS